MIPRREVPQTTFYMLGGPFDGEVRAFYKPDQHLELYASEGPVHCPSTSTVVYTRRTMMCSGLRRDYYAVEEMSDVEAEVTMFRRLWDQAAPPAPVKDVLPEMRRLCHQVMGEVYGRRNRMSPDEVEQALQRAFELGRDSR